MTIEFENEDIRNFILENKAKNKPYSKMKSNKQLRTDLDRVMRILTIVDSCNDLHGYRSLHYEALQYDLSGFSSVRLGYTTKYRLIFTEHDEGIRICLIEISEHYGDK